jgi:C_GCAxxG_C_C family probable redox protein
MENPSVLRAQELFVKHYNCAQSVYAACGRGGGLTEAQRLALAGPFGGGIAARGEVCGALIGALLALGEASEAEVAADPQSARLAVYARSSRLAEAFREAHGSIRCRELTGHNLSTEFGLRAFQESGLRQKLCSGLVAFAAEKVDEILAAEG